MSEAMLTAIYRSTVIEQVEWVSPQKCSKSNRFKGIYLASSLFPWNYVKLIWISSVYRAYINLNINSHTKLRRTQIWNLKFFHCSIKLKAKNYENESTIHSWISAIYSLFATLLPVYSSLRHLRWRKSLFRFEL